MSFVVLARALREASYLAEFDATTLPYITGAVVVVGFPLALEFGRALGRTGARRVMRTFTLLLAAAIVLVWPFLGDSTIAVVAFYMITAAGTVLLTSGFWLVVSEMLVVREARRLFGLISAGGTLGLMLTGTLTGAAVQTITPASLVPLLVLILLAFAGLNEWVPRHRPGSTSGAGSIGWTENIRSILAGDHLRTIALIVILASTIGGLVDYQFKEAAQDAFVGEADLAAFFGLFYGWTGGLAFVVQLLVSTRLMSRAGIAWSLAVLPILLLGLSAGMLFVPGIVMATALRGTDSTLRKSLFRSVLEFLWVPVAPDARRRTKTFVDTTADSVGDGIGALVVLFLVTLGGIPSRYLSVVVLAAAIGFLILARRMGRAYTATLRHRLAAGDPGDLLNAPFGDTTAGPVTLSRIDLTRLLATVADRPPGDDVWRQAGEREEDAEPPDWLAGGLPIAEEDVPVVARLLARDRIREAVARRLVDLGEPAGRPLAQIVADSTADFVVRRRVAGVLGAVPGDAARRGLMAALTADRFEVRYRAARSLSRRRDARAPEVETVVWEAIRSELSRGRAVWELARLLDPADPDEFVRGRAAARGELSLEHVFRLLSLVLDREAMHAAWGGMVGDHEELESLALEYLEQVLPPDVRDRLWPFIGDLSTEQARRAIRPLDDVIVDLLDTGATLFGGDQRRALERYLDRDDEIT